MLSAAIKRRMHRDICADPVVHGLVLNLYLNGEDYPHRVEDYFPVVDDLEPVLAQRMRAHQRDENKHIALYRKALQRLGQPELRLPMGQIYNHVIRAHTPVSFAFEPADDADRRRLKLAHFLAHLHFLERRVARSLEFHLEGCERSPTSYPSKVVGVILTDEQRHAEYTRRAVEALLPRRVARPVLDTHRRAERRANVEFSAVQLGRLLREQRARFPRATGWLYRTAALAMQKVIDHG